MKYNMTNIIYPNVNLFIKNENGNTGTIILPTSFNTPSILTKSLKTYTNGAGVSGNILSTIGSNLIWTTPSFPTLVSSGNNLNMNNNNINNVNTVTTINVNATNHTSNTTFTNQVIFNTLPTCTATPSSDYQLVNKQYADSASISNHYNYNLYLNYSQKITTVSGFPTTAGQSGNSLSTTISSATVDQTVVTTGSTTNKSQRIASFISEPLNTTSIPASFLNIRVFGLINIYTTVNQYYFTLEKWSNNGSSITLIGTSSYSPNNISNQFYTVPFPYTINLTIPAQTGLLLTDRFILTLYNYSSTGTSTVTTYFENDNYTYASLVINKSLTYLPFIKFINIANFDVNMNGYNITSTDNMSISVTNPNRLYLNSSNINIGDINTGSITFLSSGSTGTISIGAPLKPTYLTLPTTGITTGKIGEIISSTTATKITFGTSPATISYTYTLPYKGSWLTSATTAYTADTTGVITSASLNIYNTTNNNLICNQQIDASQTIATGNNNSLILNCSGILSTTNTTNTITINQKLTYSSGTFSTGSTAGTFAVQFLRLA